MFGQYRLVHAYSCRAAVNCYHQGRVRIRASEPSRDPSWCFPPSVVAMEVWRSVFHFLLEIVSTIH
jgi:hypothetical protein